MSLFKMKIHPQFIFFFGESRDFREGCVTDLLKLI